MTYRVLFHVGAQDEIEKKAQFGHLSVRPDHFLIQGEQGTVEIPFRSIRRAELFRLRGLGRMIQVECSDRTLFVSVVRFSLGKALAIIHFLKTGELHQRLLSAAAS